MFQLLLSHLQALLRYISKTRSSSALWDNFSSAVLTYKKLICNTNTIFNLFLLLFYLQYIQLMLSTTEIIVMKTPTLYTGYTECHGRNVPDFGRMFLKLK